MKLIKKYLGEIMLTIGTGLFSYNIFKFDWKRAPGKLVLLGEQNLQPIIYYYPNRTLFWITVGAVLIVIGILIIRNKK